MIKEEKFLLLVSSSTHLIMKLEKILQNSEIYCRIIPLPGEISAGCGLSIKVSLCDLERVNEIVSNNDLNVERYLIKKIGLKKEIEKL